MGTGGNPHGITFRVKCTSNNGLTASFSNNEVSIAVSGKKAAAYFEFEKTYDFTATEAQPDDDTH
jgi:hypothetical protein